MKGKIFRIDLIFRIHDNGLPNINKFDRKPIIIHAPSKREAYQNALVAASSQLELLNDKQHQMIWEFIGLENFKTIEQKEIERDFVYTIENSEDASDYIRSIRFQNSNLQQEIAQTF